MINLLKSLERFQQKAEKTLMFLSGFIILFLMFLITIDVTMRKLGNPLPGSVELVQILTVSIVFLGVAYVQKVKGHIFIEVATDKLPNKAKQGLDFIGYLIGLVICAIVTWQSGLAAWESIKIMEYATGIVHIPLWPAKVIIAIGMASLTTRMVWDILFYLFPVLKLEQTQLQQIEEGDEVWL
ncbi:TRAP transporter small permease [Niallia sp. Krafla_26]|uniref:TRAP transporter small permease n=1 Tax=Niallia sp. Krafla_26 TaxID=3064703 RepID=UPI003D176EB5